MPNAAIHSRTIDKTRDEAINVLEESATAPTMVGNMKTPLLERVRAAPDQQHSQRAKGVRDQRQRADGGQISDAHRFDDSRQPEAERVDAAEIGEEDESEEVDARALEGIAKAAMRRRYGPISFKRLDHYAFVLAAQPLCISRAVGRDE